MKYKQLGNTGVLVSELCFGTMTFGGKGMWEAMGKVPQSEATQLIKLAVDSGINFIDTANVYSEGLSETLLGQALKDLEINREQVVISTKVRGRMGPGANQIGLSKLHILNSVDDSLRRLGTDIYRFAFCPWCRSSDFTGRNYESDGRFSVCWKSSISGEQ